VWRDIIAETCIEAGSFERFRDALDRRTLPFDHGVIAQALALPTANVCDEPGRQSYRGLPFLRRLLSFRRTSEDAPVAGVSDAPQIAAAREPV
jgi:hypothetical protein